MPEQSTVGPFVSFGLESPLAADTENEEISCKKETNCPCRPLDKGGILWYTENRKRKEGAGNETDVLEFFCGDCAALSFADLIRL